MPGSSSTISSFRGLSVTAGCCHKYGRPPKQRIHRNAADSRRRQRLRRAEEGRDLPHHVLALLGRELGIDRQRQHLVRRRAATRGKSSRLVLEIGEAALSMQRHRIVDLRADAFGREMGAQLVALRRANHVLIEDVPEAWHARRHLHRVAEIGRAKQLVVVIRVGLPRARPGVEMLAA